MAVHNETRYQIMKHNQPVEGDENCMICDEKLEELAPLQPPEDWGRPQGIFGGRQIVVLASATVRAELPLRDMDLVHLSCHPNQVYHHKCIKTWINRNNSCPLDRREIDRRSPTVSTLSSEDKKAQSIALSFFRK